VHCIQTGEWTMKFWTLRLMIRWDWWSTQCHVRFQVLTAASMKFRVFWDVAPCSHVEVYWSFRGAYCIHHQGDDGRSTHLWNVSQLRCDYTALHPRRLNFTHIVMFRWFHSLLHASLFAGWKSFINNLQFSAFWFMSLFSIKLSHHHHIKLNLHLWKTEVGSIHVGFVVDKVALGRFLRVLRFPLQIYNSTIAPYSSISAPWGVRLLWPSSTLSQPRSSVRGFTSDPAYWLETERESKKK
jgi:hypothetical protein